MNSFKFPSTPSRTPRNVRKGQWPHPTPLSRGERKARHRANAETRVVILRTPEGLAGATTRTVRVALRAEAAPSFLDRISAALVRLGRRLFCHSF